MHILTNNSQFGYKGKLSATDEIQKIEERINHATQDTHILLMDLSKAFGAVNRSLMWASLYEKGLPVSPIQQIWRGHQNAKLMAKSHNQYGRKVEITSASSKDQQ